MLEAIGLSRMNSRTLEKLKQNPHYKIGAKQYTSGTQDDPNHMVEIGRVPKEKNGFAIHQTEPNRVQRTGKNVKKVS